MQCTNCKVKVDPDGIIGVHKGDALTASRGFAFVLDDSNGLSAHACGEHTGSTCRGVARLPSVAPSSTSRACMSPHN